MRAPIQAWTPETDFQSLPEGVDMFIPFVIFLVLSGLCISAMGWFAIIPIFLMWGIMGFISDSYTKNDGER